MIDVDINDDILVAGIDEAGRGSWAGPVVSAAVILNADIKLASLKDSKKLTSKKREETFGYLKTRALLGVGFASVKEIEELNILQATLLSMQRAVFSLPVQPQIIMVDGCVVPKKLQDRAMPIVKGDQFVPVISAASIVAKVVRDNHMALLNKKYPGYYWDKNSGYGVKAHFLALKTLGLTPSHRRSFKPIHNILYEEN